MLQFTSVVNVLALNAISFEVVPVQSFRLPVYHQLYEYKTSYIRKQAMPQLSSRRRAKMEAAASTHVKRRWPSAALCCVCVTGTCSV